MKEEFCGSCGRIMPEVHACGVRIDITPDYEKHQDIYWLRMFSMAAMQEFISLCGKNSKIKADVLTSDAVKFGCLLLEEIKRVENNNNKKEE